MKETIPFTIKIDGETYPIENWMLVAALALKGVPWAVEQVSRPDYSLRNLVKDYERRKSIYFLKKDIDYYNKELNKAYKRLSELEIPNER